MLRWPDGRDHAPSLRGNGSPTRSPGRRQAAP